MKRAFAIAALVAAVAVLTKLTFKPLVPDSSSSSVPIAHSPIHRPTKETRYSSGPKIRADREISIQSARDT